MISKCRRSNLINVGVYIYYIYLLQVSRIEKITIKTKRLTYARIKIRRIRIIFY